MSLENWQESSNPIQMLQYLGIKAGRRKLMLFGVACCQPYLSLLSEPARNSLTLAESYADGKVSYEEVNNYRHKESRRIIAFLRENDDFAFPIQAEQAAFQTMIIVLIDEQSLLTYTNKILHHIRLSSVKWDTSREEIFQSNILRCLFGNEPDFDSKVPLSRDWLSWNDGAISKIAHGIYNDKSFGDMPILADAFEDAGCTDKRILEHCRGTVHVKGDWLLDKVLGFGRDIPGQNRGQAR